MKVGLLMLCASLGLIASSFFVGCDWMDKQESAQKAQREAQEYQESIKHIQGVLARGVVCAWSNKLDACFCFVDGWREAPSMTWAPDKVCGK